jgi:hypothetical protein
VSSATCLSRCPRALRTAAPIVLALVWTLAGADAGAQTLLSQGRPAVASSTEASGFSAANAVDGNGATRWSSAFSDPQWIYVDLGASATVTRVVLQWEAAYGRAYQIQVSNDAATWTTIFSTTSGTGGVNDLAVSGSGRYVRMNGTQRGTVWGYSLFELQVYGSSGGGAQGPFGGSPRAIPGLIQAEDYDTGGEGVAYHDTTAGNSGGAYRSDGVDIEATTDSGGGFDVGWTDVGEWLEYTVNVATTGSYTLEARVASLSTGGTLHVEMDGVNVSGTVTLPSTGGWQNWTSVTKSVSLTAGAHVMRLALDSAGFNLNFLRFTSGTTPSCNTLPGVPSGLSSPSKTSSSVNLSWNASTPGANCTVSYRVFQNGAQATQVSTTSATISGLAASTSYSFTVAAVNQFGSSAQSGALSVTTAASGNGGGRLQSTFVTSYGYNDNDDGNGHFGTAVIAYPNAQHAIATEGSGTFDDPVTFATDPREIAPQTIIYVPHVRKYFRMEDGCAECTTDWNSGNWHIDLFMGPNNALQPEPALANCEDSVTRNAPMYIGAGPGWPVDTQKMFQNGQCTVHLY